MSFLPILPAAPKPAISGADLSLSSGQPACASGLEEQADSSFEDALARSSTEEKRRDPDESTEPSLAVAMLTPPAPFLPAPGLELPDPVSLQETNTGEPVETLNPGLWMPEAQPTPEQPFPISKSWVQAAYQNPAALPVETLQALQVQNGVAGPVTGDPLKQVEFLNPAVAGSIDAIPGDLPADSAAGPDLSGPEILSPPGSVLDPAKTAGPVLGTGLESKAEQIASVLAVQDPEGEAKNASLSATLALQSAAVSSETGLTELNRQNSVGDAGHGMSGAAERRSMSVSQLQPSPGSGSQESVESPGEGSRVLTRRAGNRNGKEGVDFGNGLGTAVDGQLNAEGTGVPAGLSRVHGVFQTGSSLAEGAVGLNAPSAQPTSSVHSTSGGFAQPDAARVLEHLEATLAKYRPNVPPHLEIQVDLLGGDTLDVRLDLRGEALQSTFRTDSPELRLALQRAWPEFVERSLQQGLNLAPASFDSTGTFPDSSAGSQADSRRQTPQEGDGPLPEAFRKTPSQFAGKVSEPAQGAKELARTRWA